MMEVIHNEILESIANIDTKTCQVADPEALLDTVRDFARRLARLADPSLQDVGAKLLAKKTGIPVATVRRETKNARAVAYAADPTAGVVVRIKDVLPGAPVGDDVLLPPDIQLSEAGTFLSVEKDGQAERVRVCPVPVVLTGRLKILDDSDVEELEIAFLRDGHWHHIVMPRNIAFSSRKVLDSVAVRGLPVTDAKAKHLVKVFERYESANLQTLPVFVAVRRTGWHALEEQTFFALGDHAIGMGPDNGIRLAVSGGERQSLAQIKTRGTLEQWAAAVETLSCYPRIIFAVYASLAAPLLRWTGVSNFVVHNGGDSSTGKTLASRVAASVWGSAGNQDGLVQPWDGTVNYATMKATLFCDLPLFLDDSQTERPETVQNMIFRLASGGDRGRLTKDAQIRERQSYRSVAMTTGEQHIGDCTQYAGASARLIAFWGGTLPPGQKELADEIHSMVRSYYGVAGVEYLNEVVRSLHDDRKNISVEAVNQHTQELLARHPVAGSVEGRIANYFGLIALAAKIAHRVFQWTFDAWDVIDRCFSDAIGQQSARRDVPKSALEDVQSWVTANRAAFWNGADNSREPHGGWLGVWRPAAYCDGTSKYTAIRREVLHGQLKSWGYDDPRSIVRHWGDRRWLRSQSADRTTCKVSMGDERPWMYVVLVE